MFITKVHWLFSNLSFKEAEEAMVEKKNQGRIIEVTGYSGYKANERPLHFIVDQKRNEVKRVLDRWYGQDHDYFKVLTDDGRVYMLKWHRASDTWFLQRLEI